MTHARHLRIICEPDTDKPWVVQYSTADTQTWTDVYRFHRSEDAVRYVNEISARDRLLGTER